jgi:hypothetical protein
MHLIHGIMSSILAQHASERRNTFIVYSAPPMYNILVYLSILNIVYEPRPEVMVGL